MSTTDLLLRFSFGPTALALAAALVAGYLRLGGSRSGSRGGSRSGRRALLFGAGVLALLAALCSPLDELANGYVFTAHMVQHLILLLVVPALLLLGLPPDAAARALSWRPLAWLERHAAQGPLAWMLGTGVMWFWHVPSLCAASLRTPLLRDLQAVSLVGAGTAFAWPILAPVARRRLATLPAVGYLLAACTACTLLGAWLTFSPLSVCPGFYDLGAVPELRALVRGGWGLSERADVQLAGLSMWVPTCLVYLGAILHVMARAYAAEEEVPHGV